jgi:hypothetical protein
MNPINQIIQNAGGRFDVNGRPDTNFTVAEAARFLTCSQPISLKLLGQLGKDCSMVCRIKNIPWTERAVAQAWGKERAYPPAVLKEVFELNPETAPFVPKTQ